MNINHAGRASHNWGLQNLGPQQRVKLKTEGKGIEMLKKRTEGKTEGQIKKRLAIKDMIHEAC